MIKPKKSFELKYNYATALLINNKVQEAKEMYNKLLAEEEYDIFKVEIIFVLAFCEYLLNNKKGCENLLKKLTEEFLETGYLDLDEIAGLYYLCGNYEEAVKWLDNDIWKSISYWISIYFYSLKKLKKFKKIEETFNKIKKYTREIIEDILKNKERTKQEKESQILFYNEGLNEIISEYEKVMKSDKYKPKIEIEPYGFKGECYLIDCPQHQEI